MDPATLAESEAYRVVDAQWPGIISMDLFNDVQSLLESNKKRTRPYVHHYRLAGMVWCGVCGAKLVGKSGTGRTGKYFYYGHMRQLTLVDDRHLKRCPWRTSLHPRLKRRSSPGSTSSRRIGSSLFLF